MSEAGADGKFECAVESNNRMRSSFIYLANAVNDLRGNWSTLALVLAPLVVSASLCLLPDALNLQYRVAQALEPPNSQNVMYVGYRAVQTPYAPPHNVPPGRQPYPGWLTSTLDLVVLILGVVAGLLVLCMLARIRARERAPTVLGETFAIYRKALTLAPGFAWIALLQAIAPILALAFLTINFNPQDPATYLAWGIVRTSIVAAAAVVYLWLYFAEYALVFDGKHSFHALLYSRDLMRKRFFRVSTRIVVFLAVWSGYNSWAAVAFVAVSRLMGPVAVVTGLVAITILLLDLISVGVSFATAAFFIAAGLRLYQDLNGLTAVESVAAPQEELQATAPLSGAS